MNSLETSICVAIAFAIWLIQLAPRKAPLYGAESIGRVWRNKVNMKKL